jgi:hypothetical protein
MSSIVADDVFWRIEWIAHSVEALEGRRVRAEARIDEFIADLAKANLPPGAADKTASQLEAKLERPNKPGRSRDPNKLGKLNNMAPAEASPDA